MRTLAALRANGVPLIHAFSDGARGADDAADVGEVRRILRAVDWTELHLVEHPANLGLSASIVRGISDVLALHDETIVCARTTSSSPGARTTTSSRRSTGIGPTRA